MAIFLSGLLILTLFVGSVLFVAFVGFDVLLGLVIGLVNFFDFALLPTRAFDCCEGECCIFLLFFLDGEIFSFFFFFWVGTTGRVDFFLILFSSFFWVIAVISNLISSKKIKGERVMKQVDRNNNNNNGRRQTKKRLTSITQGREHTQLMWFSVEINSRLPSCRRDGAAAAFLFGHTTDTKLVQFT